MMIKFPEIIVKALAKADAALAGEVYQAIMAYALQGVLPEGLSPAADALFTLAKELISPAGTKAKPRKRKSCQLPEAKPEPVAEVIEASPAAPPERLPSQDISISPPCDYSLHDGVLYGLRRPDLDDWILRERRYIDRLRRKSKIASS